MLFPCPYHVLFGRLVVRHGSVLRGRRVEFVPWGSAQTFGAGFGVVELL